MAKTEKNVAESVKTEAAKPAVKKQSLQEMVSKLKQMVDDDLTEFSAIGKLAATTKPDLKNIADIANSAAKAIRFFIDNFDNDILTKPVVNDGTQTVKLVDPSNEAFNKLMILKKVKDDTKLKL